MRVVGESWVGRRVYIAGGGVLGTVLYAFSPTMQEEAGEPEFEASLLNITSYRAARAT